MGRFLGTILSGALSSAAAVLLLTSGSLTAAAENKVSVHDFHATVLHLLGMNHRNLVFEREGRKERITDEFPARVLSEIIA